MKVSKDDDIKITIRGVRNDTLYNKGCKSIKGNFCGEIN